MWHGSLKKGCAQCVYEEMPPRLRAWREVDRGIFMKLAIIRVFGLTALALGLSSSVEAQFFEVQVSAGNHDNYVVVQRERGTVIIEEPAPRVVIVEAPPPRQRPVVVRPEPPCVGAIWVEGYWQYTGVRFVWVRGHWIPPRYGYRFVQPRWHVHTGYHYYTPGYFRPRNTQIRRQPYYRYRPRPGYVYYRGQQRPYYREYYRYGDYERRKDPNYGHYRHHENPNHGHYKRDKNPNHGHYKHDKNPNHGHYKRDMSRVHRPKPYEAPGRQRGQAHARSPQRAQAQPVQRSTARSQSRPSVPRERISGSRNARPSRGRR